MIPILYDKDETVFDNNGLGRLRDVISCKVSEERNGIYECDFEYPVDGAHYDEIVMGRSVVVEHDDTGDVQPFDIQSYSEPINGIVTFHCVHISYRQSKLTVTGQNINSLADAFALLKDSATPTNPFTYSTDKTSTGYFGAANGIPKSVRQMLGGVEGSILDAYGGEYEWNRFNVILHERRGRDRDFTIRYGVNMTNYNNDSDSSGCYSACVPYWTDGTTTIVGDKQTTGELPPSGREECIPIDVSERFEEQPTKAQVEAAGLAILDEQNPHVPTQNISVSFVRLQDTAEYAQLSDLLRCSLCDTINVVFPTFKSSARFKIVKTVWDVLGERYESMELGNLSVSLSEALGVGGGSSYVGNSGSGTRYSAVKAVAITTANINTYAIGASITLPAGTYIIVGQWYYNSASGARAIDIDLALDNSTSSSSGANLLARQRISAQNGSWASLEATALATFDATTTVYVKGSATVTSTAQNASISAIRIA